MGFLHAIQFLLVLSKLFLGDSVFRANLRMLIPQARKFLPCALEFLLRLGVRLAGAVQIILLFGKLSLRLLMVGAEFGMTLPHAAQALPKPLDFALRRMVQL